MRLLCENCGRKFDLPEGHARAKCRCAHCGYYVAVPAQMRATPKEAQAAPVLKNKAKSKGAPPPLLVGNDDEESDAPYSVPGDATKKCTACYREIAYDATFCTLCGTELASGRKAKKEFEPIDRTWEPRWNLDVRLKFLGALLALDIVLAIFISSETSILGGIQSVTLQGALQAFLVGTFESIRVERSANGSAKLTKYWRFAFYQAKAIKLDWKKSQGVGIIATRNAGLLEWFTFIYLILLGVLPGVLFYFFVIRPDRFHVVLCDVHGTTDEVAFRTTDRDQADEICKVINNATGLWYKPVL